jgi:hypothetical protein
MKKSVLGVGLLSHQKEVVWLLTNLVAVIEITVAAACWRTTPLASRPTGLSRPSRMPWNHNLITYGTEMSTWLAYPRGILRHGALECVGCSTPQLMFE